MTLTIQKLVTKAKIPRPFHAGRALVDQVARERFGLECARRLDRPWPMPPGVIRIRKLQVRVSLAPLELKPEALAAAWAAAAIKRRVRTTPGAKKLRIVRVDMVSPAVSPQLNDF